MKNAIQPVLILLALIALIYGILKVARETTTMILPVWMVVVFITSIVCLTSAGLGLMVKNMLGSPWHQMSFAAIIIIIVVGVYSVIDFKPASRIIVPIDYAGTVKLYVSSREADNRSIIVNQSGVGYISRSEFEKGFYPRVVKGDRDITGQINEYRKEKRSMPCQIVIALDICRLSYPANPDPARTTWIVC
ncbi:hypothetical protein ACQ86N_21845 [Puia sp. P3]|uniref:hypothetical protein n=1 Tax=Puia sp. P3 TaxID=3423952 RepID=UPI003D676901